MKKQIVDLLRKIANFLDREKTSPFSVLTDVIVETPTKELEVAKTAKMLRDSRIEDLHKKAIEIFIEERWPTTEDVYWKLSSSVRQEYLDEAIKRSL